MSEAISDRLLESAAPGGQRHCAAHQNSDSGGARAHTETEGTVEAQPALLRRVPADATTGGRKNAESVPDAVEPSRSAAEVATEKSHRSACPGGSVRAVGHAVSARAEVEAVDEVGSAQARDRQGEGLPNMEAVARDASSASPARTHAIATSAC